MTDLYSEWRDFYAEKVLSWMSLEELRAECGKLQTVDSRNPEVLLVHAMHALEELQAEVERLRDDGASAVQWAPGSAYQNGWEDAPPWANYKAQDSCGDWWWYEKRPRPEHRSWVPRGRYELYKCDKPNPWGWENTLKRRRYTE